MTFSGVELLRDANRRGQFGCGKSALDNWLKAYARSNHARGFTRVLVVHDADQAVGYYGLAPTVVEASVVPRAIRTGRPPDPIPCLLIGQLAVDTGYAGRGTGSALVKDALRRCTAGAISLEDELSSSGQSTPKQRDFWQDWGFVPARDNPSICMRSIEDVRLWLKDP